MYRIAVCDDDPIFVKQISEMTAAIFISSSKDYALEADSAEPVGHSLHQAL